MPLFQIDIQKTGYGEIWTNRYILDAVSLSQAHDSALTFMLVAEQSIHAAAITIDRIRTSTLTPNDNLFLTAAPNAVGTFTASGNALPLFNVVRADMTMSTGRPSRKYYRGGWGTGQVGSHLHWDGSDISGITALLNGLRSDLDGAGTPWVDEDGDAVMDATAFTLIGMRQLRRGSRRRTEPII